MKYTLTQAEYEELKNGKERAEKQLKDFKEKLKKNKDSCEVVASSWFGNMTYFYVGEDATRKILETKDYKIDKLKSDIDKLNKKIEENKMIVEIYGELFQFDRSLLDLKTGDKVDVSWSRFYDLSKSSFRPYTYRRSISKRKKGWFR